MTDMQAKYYEFQMLQEQLQNMQQQIAMVKKQIEELEKVDQALTSVKDAKEGNQILCPIGAGVYLKTKLEKADEIVMAVGANVCVTKRSVDAKSQVEHQIEEMYEILKKMELEQENATTQISKLQQEIQLGMQQEQECGPKCDHEHE